MAMITYTITYIGLPDMQYRDVTVNAACSGDACAMGDAYLLSIYGRDDFDIATCMPVGAYVDYDRLN